MCHRTPAENREINYPFKQINDLLPHPDMQLQQCLLSEPHRPQKSTTSAADLAAGTALITQVYGKHRKRLDKRFSSMMCNDKSNHTSLLSKLSVGYTCSAK